MGLKTVTGRKGAMFSHSSARTLGDVVERTRGGGLLRRHGACLGVVPPSNPGPLAMRQYLTSVIRHVPRPKRSWRRDRSPMLPLIF